MFTNLAKRRNSSHLSMIEVVSIPLAFPELRCQKTFFLRIHGILNFSVSGNQNCFLSTLKTMYTFKINGSNSLNTCLKLATANSILASNHPLDYICNHTKLFCITFCHKPFQIRNNVCWSFVTFFFSTNNSPGYHRHWADSNQREYEQRHHHDIPDDRRRPKPHTYLLVGSKPGQQIQNARLTSHDNRHGKSELRTAVDL